MDWLVSGKQALKMSTHQRSLVWHFKTNSPSNWLIRWLHLYFFNQHKWFCQECKDLLSNPVALQTHTYTCSIDCVGWVMSLSNFTWRHGSINLTGWGSGHENPLRCSVNKSGGHHMLLMLDWILDEKSQGARKTAGSCSTPGTKARKKVRWGGWRLWHQSPSIMLWNDFPFTVYSVISHQ